MNFLFSKLNLKPGSKLFEFLHIKERIQRAGQKPFPKIFRHGDVFITEAAGYLSPWRFLIWYYLRIVLAILAVIVGVASGILWLFGEMPFGVLMLIFSVSGIALFLLIFETDEKLGRLILGKKTVVEFSEEKIVLYRNGYGMSFPHTIPRDPNLPVSFIVDRHEKRETLQTGHNQFTRTRYSMYRNTFVVKMVHGSHVEKVADVYSDQRAKDLSTGLQKTEAERLAQSSAHREEQQKKEDIPE